MKKNLLVLLVLTMLYFLFQQETVFAQKDPFFGINVENKASTENRNFLLDMGFNRIRFGINRLTPENSIGVGDPINFGPVDEQVDWYLSNGIELMAVIPFNIENEIDKGLDYEEWKANWDYYCRQVFSHLQGRVFYYILDNEPDLTGSTPQQCYDMTKIAYLAAQDIDPNIKIESPPVMGSDGPSITSYLRQMLNLGIADYCDYIGLHSYGSQIDDNRLDAVWKELESHNVRKPVSISELGVKGSWAPAGVEDEEWRRRWWSQYYVASKAHGFTNNLCFTLDGGPTGWQIKNTPSFDELKNYYFLRSFENGGFESANDDEHDWHVVFPTVDQANPPSNIEFVLNDATNARSGSGYLRMDAGNGKSVRRVAENLTPGQTYTVKGYAYISGSGTASLSAMGYDTEDGDAKVVSSTSNTGSFQLLSLDVTPTSTWIVVDLSMSNIPSGGFVIWDDISVAGTSSISPTIYQAEDYSMQSGCTIETEHSGYTGTGFLDYGSSGTWGEWSAVSVTSSGVKTVDFYYANGSSSNRQCEIIVNGVNAGSIAFVPTGSWTTWDIASVDVNLNAGNNTIRVKANTSSGGPNLDKFELSGENGSTVPQGYPVIHSYSAAQSGNGPEKLLDGNTSDDSRWSANGFPQWVIIDYGASVPMTGIRLWTYQDRAYQFKVELSDDLDFSGDLVVDKLSNTSSYQPIADDFPTVNARYAKISVTGASGYSGSWSSLTEFKVVVDGELKSGSIVTGFNNSTSETVNMYPNPLLNHALTIELGNTDGASVSIYDITGRLVYNSLTSDQSLTVERYVFKSGLHFVKIITNNQIEVLKLFVV